jgi:hypothetical protein
LTPPPGQVEAPTARFRSRPWRGSFAKLAQKVAFQAVIGSDNKHSRNQFVSEFSEGRLPADIDASATDTGYEAA